MVFYSILIYFTAMLTKQEESELIRLMDKIRFPVSRELFFAWCKTFVTVSADVIVIRKSAKGGEVFLTYREDEFYKGWHIPGSIRLPNELLDDARRRVLVTEVGLLKDTKTDFFTWVDYPYGSGVGESPRGPVISLYFCCVGQSEIKETSEGRFFRLSELPEDILPIHVPIMKMVKDRFSI